MIRSSLVVFLVAVVLGLALTVGYALTMPGPATAIQEAEQHLARGRAVEAVRVLDLAEGSPAVKADRDLRVRLLRARFAAQQAVGNPRRALADLEAVLPLLAEPDEALLLDQIALLATLERGDDALAAARTFVAAHPDHARGLELAGEAANVAYRESLRQVAAAVRRDLAGADENAGNRARLHFLYRPEGDPAVQAGLRRLAELYATRTNRQQAWLSVEPQLQALRPRIQEGLDWSRRSLEAGGQPVAAWRGLSFALQQADRTDDVVALGEIYLLRFQHLYAAEAAGTIAMAHVADGLPEAAVEVTRRFLPREDAIARVERGELDARVTDVLVAEAQALAQLRDGAGLLTLALKAADLQKAGLQVGAGVHWAGVHRALLTNNATEAEAHLVALGQIHGRLPPPLRGPDPLASVVALRLPLLAARAAPDSEVLALLDTWARAPGRTDSLEPLLARARYQIARGQGSAALGTVGEALRRAPQDEAVLALLAQAAAACYQPSGQDGPGLLDQCRRRKVTVPDVPHPVCYLLAAEAALRAGIPPIARDCARRGIDKFSWSRWPRQLEARALLLLGEPAAAASTLEQTLALFPDDGTSLELLLQARERTGQSFGPLLFDVARTCDPDPYLAEALLRAALLGDDADAALALARGANRLPEPTPSLRILQAWAFALGGDGAAAATAWPLALQATAGTPTPEQRRDLLAGGLERLILKAPLADDAALDEEARTILFGAGADGEAAHRALLRAAVRIAEHGRSRTALRLVTTALDLNDQEERRTGADFALAGRLALQVGQVALAEDHWTAAISFADGAAVAEDLARLALLAGRPDKAAAALPLAPILTDPALALRLLGPAAAEPAVAVTLAQDPTDLAGRLVQALVVPPAAAGALADGLRELPADARDELLTLLTSLRAPELAAPLRERAEALADAHLAAPGPGLLRARFRLLAGDAQGAAREHQRLWKMGCRDLALLGEVARSSATLAYPLPADIHTAITAQATGGGDVPGVLRAYAVRAAASEVHRSGRPDLAQVMLGDLWLLDPRHSGARVADAMSLAANPATQRTAIGLFHRLWPELQGAQLRTCLDGLFFLADSLLAQASAADGFRLSESARRTALDVIEKLGPRGPAVWFLLRDDARRLDANRAFAATDDATARRWFDGQLELTARGDDTEWWAARLLDDQAARFGDGSAVAAAERLLRQRPAMLSVWQKRAELLARQQQAEQGLADLRRILTYADDPDLLLGTVTLAARARQTRPGDAEALAALPQARRDSPAGRWARGLVALRRGRAGEAVTLLQQAPPQPDGAHLYFQALAALVRGGPEAKASAAAAFARLAADYPSSSLARYSGSFARQLTSSP